MIRRLIILLLIVGCVFADVISVTGFKNNTSNPNNDWIGEAIADNLTTDLSKIDKIKVVSRSSLKDVLKEQKFTHSGLVEQDKSIEIGKMVGANTLLSGDYTVFNGVLIINGQFTDIESGVIKSSVKVEGNFNDLYLLQKQLAQKVLEELGVDIDEKDRIKISQVSTENVKALEKNYMGVIALDNEEVDNAIALFKEAVSIDPYYQEAKSNLKSSEVQVSGGLLFASALNLNDKKEKQRDALRLIYDTFIDNYLTVEISGQEIVSDMEDPNNVFIEIEFTITQNVNVATKFTKDIKNISEGNMPVFNTVYDNWTTHPIFPDDFWLIKNIKIILKNEAKSFYLFKENFDWVKENYIGEYSIQP